MTRTDVASAFPEDYYDPSTGITWHITSATTEYTMAISSSSSVSAAVKSVDQIIAASMADTITQALTPEIRERLLAEAVKSLLGSSKLQDLAATALTERAGRLIPEIVAEGSYDEQIRFAVAQALTKVLEHLQAATIAAAVAALAGREGSGYGHDNKPSLLLAELKTRLGVR
jgi:hypothetical protein